MLGDRAGAEDAVQDAFCGLYRHWDRLADRDRALAYVRTSVLNGCRSALRRRATGRGLTEYQPPTASAEAAVLGLEERQEVMRAVRQLPGRQREALVLRFYLDLPEREIARLMGLRPSSVRSATARRPEGARPRSGGAVMTGWRTSCAPRCGIRPARSRRRAAAAPAPRARRRGARPGLARPALLDRLGGPAGRRGRGPRGGRRLAGRGPRRVRAHDERTGPAGAVPPYYVALTAPAYPDVYSGDPRPPRSGPRPPARCWRRSSRPSRTSISPA